MYKFCKTVLYLKFFQTKIWSSQRNVGQKHAIHLLKNPKWPLISPFFQ
jgi:hypothetical protein